jgi:hypothetical protein
MKLSIEEVARRANIAIKLKNQMDDTFEHKEDDLLISFMAVIAEAYNDGYNEGYNEGFIATKVNI